MTLMMMIKEVMKMTPVSILKFQKAPSVEQIITTNYTLNPEHTNSEEKLTVKIQFGLRITELQWISMEENDGHF